MFRAMKAEADGLPKAGRSSRELGIRIDGQIRDLPVGEDGTVEPETGGMSVALDAAQNLPSRVSPDPLGEKAGIRSSLCEGQMSLKR